MGIESPSLAYAVKTVTRSIIFAVDVPYPLLKAWNELIKTYNNNNSRNVTNNTQRCADSKTRTAAGTRLQFAPLTVLDFWPCCAVSENVYAVNEAFFGFDLFTILPSLQVIHCGKNTVQENEIFSDSNKCYRNTRESHCEPAACFKPPWNRVKCFSVQFQWQLSLDLQSSFADKSTVPY